MKKQGTSTGWAYMLLSMMLIGFALTLIGCKGKQIITETVRTEYIDRYVHDTIRVDNLTQILDSVRESVIESVKDCVVIVKDTAGNVINTAQWHFKDTSKELSHSKEKVDSTAYYRSIVDSLRRIKNDSTYITKVVEKKLSLWDRTKIKFGGLAFVGGLHDRVCQQFALEVFQGFHVADSSRLRAVPRRAHPGRKCQACFCRS